MFSQAKGELRAARVEIDKLREGNAVLSRALETKSKEVRMQLVQVRAPKYSVSRHGRLNSCPCLYRKYHSIFVSIQNGLQVVHIFLDG